MHSTTIALCRELAEEANAIIKYTEDIRSIETENEAAADVLADIRLDELEHVQKLALALSRVLIGTDDDTPDAGGDAE